MHNLMEDRWTWRTTYGESPFFLPNLKSKTVSLSSGTRVHFIHPSAWEWALVYCTSFDKWQQNLLTAMQLDPVNFGHQFWSRWMLHLLRQPGILPILLKIPRWCWKVINLCSKMSKSFSEIISSFFNRVSEVIQLFARMKWFIIKLLHPSARCCLLFLPQLIYSLLYHQCTIQ